MRIGVGFDAHRFVRGRRFVLGGVVIPHSAGLEGWSDADVLIHAVADALLGAAAAGDIGEHFPPGDPKYKAASSVDLLREVASIVRQAGFEVVNVDSVVVLEEPKIAPHRAEMAKTMAGALGIDSGRVSVKASTSEGLGFAGRGEGAAAYAVALVNEVNSEK